MFLAEIQKEAGQHHAHPYAISTVEAISKIYQHRELLSSLSESSMPAEFARLVGLHPEPGLIVGSSSSTRSSSLQSIVDTLMMSYEICKENNQLEIFFYEAFDSDPCINARIARLGHFLALKSNASIPPETFDDLNYDPHTAQIILHELYSWVGIHSEKYTDINFPTFDEFKCFLNLRKLSSQDIRDVMELSDDETLDKLYSVAKEAYL